MVRHGIQYEILWRDELCVIIMVAVGSVRVLVMNSYIKPRTASGKRTDKVGTARKHWSKLSELRKSKQVHDFIWTGDFNLSRS